MRKGSERGLAHLVVALFGVVVVLVGIVFAVLLASVDQQRDDLQRGRRTSDLLGASRGAQFSVLNAETAVRGYRQTGHERFLAPYRAAERSYPGQLAQLELLARGARERRLVGSIVRGARSYFADYARPAITLPRRADSRAEALLAERGRAAVDALRAQFVELDAVELAARAQRRASLGAGATRTVVIASVGLAASVLMLLALGGYILTRILQPMRRVANAAEQLAEGDLTVRVRDTGRGEVRLLGQSFNAMATALQSREAELSEANQKLERAAGAAEQASRMKSSFLANMSHEIRTPLSGVVGMTSLLARTELTDEQREYVETARASSEMLMTVVSDILDVSKIEAGRMELEQRDFDLRDLVAAGCGMLAEQASAKGVQLRVTVHDDVPRIVRGDRLRVGQILANLVSNAVKFTAEGEIAVDVSVAERRGDATDVRFEVRDTGIGIDPGRLASLFEPFAQADAGTTRQYGGSGLGLTICRDLARLMGGTIEAQSEPGHGSAFRFVIPFEPASAEPTAPAAAADLSGLRVLVAVADAPTREGLDRHLSSWGMRPAFAGDADDALEQLLDAAAAGEPFELALLDVAMASPDGPGLSRRIGESPRLRATRLIALASPQDAAIEPGLARVERPIGPSPLLDAIQAAVRGPLPVHDPTAAATPGPTPAPAAARDGARPAGNRILAVEDNPANRLYIERLLTRCGHAVSLAFDGRDALRAHAAESFDVILMDCQMPELDGYEVTAEIRRREREEGVRRTPIIAMTAGALEGARDECLRAGMDDYLSKPFDERDLLALLGRWLPAPDAVLDAERIAELQALFPGELAREMWSELIATMAADLERIDAAMAADEPAAVAAAAHRIRGSAAMIGAAALVDVAAEVQGDARRAAAEGRSPGPAAIAELGRRWGAALDAIGALQPTAVEADGRELRREGHPNAGQAV